MVVSSLFQVSSKSTTRGFKDIVQLPLQTAGTGKEDNQSINRYKNEKPKELLLLYNNDEIHEEWSHSEWQN